MVTDERIIFDAIYGLRHRRIILISGNNSLIKWAQTMGPLLRICSACGSNYSYNNSEIENRMTYEYLFPSINILCFESYSHLGARLFGQPYHNILHHYNFFNFRINSRPTNHLNSVQRQKSI